MKKNATEYQRTVGKLQKGQHICNGNLRNRKREGTKIFELIMAWEFSKINVTLKHRPRKHREHKAG